jgi:hypothetical protein
MHNEWHDLLDKQLDVKCMALTKLVNICMSVKYANSDKLQTVEHHRCVLCDTFIYSILDIGRGIAQGVSRWLPTEAARVRSRGLVKWNLWWTKWRWGGFSPSTSVSPASLHSTKFSIIIITRDRLQ